MAPKKFCHARPRSLRRLSILLTFSFTAPYFMLPVQALANPASHRKGGGRDYGTTGWKEVLKKLAEGRASKAANQPEAAKKAFEAAAEYARDFLNHAPEKNDGTLIVGGDPSPKPDVYYRPNLVRLYAYFEMGLLETEPKQRSLWFSKAAASFPSEIFAKDYPAYFVFRIRKLGQLEDLRLSQKLDARKLQTIHDICRELNEDFELDAKNHFRPSGITRLTKKGELGSIFTGGSPAEDVAAGQFLDEIQTALEQEIPYPQFVEWEADQTNGSQRVKYKVTSLAPPQLIETMPGRTEVSYLDMDDSEEDIQSYPVNRETTKVTAEFDSEYVKLAKRLHPEGQDKKYRELAFKATEPAAVTYLASVPGNNLPSRGLQISGLTAYNTKGNDKIYLTLKDPQTQKEQKQTLVVKQDTPAFPIVWEKVQPFGASAELSVSFERDGKTNNLTPKPISVHAEARPEAAYYTSSNKGAFALLMVRYAAFEKPDGLTLNKEKHPFSVVEDGLDEEGRSVYWIPVLTENQAPMLMAGNSTANLNTSLKMSPTVKEAVEKLLPANLLAEDNTPLTPEVADRLLALPDQTEIKALRPALSKYRVQTETARILTAKARTLEELQTQKTQLVALKTLAQEAHLTDELDGYVKQVDSQMDSLKAIQAGAEAEKAPAVVTASVAPLAGEKEFVAVQYTLTNFKPEKNDRVTGIRINNTPVPFAPKALSGTIPFVTSRKISLTLDIAKGDRVYPPDTKILNPPKPDDKPVPMTPETQKVIADATKLTTGELPADLSAYQLVFASRLRKAILASKNIAPLDTKDTTSDKLTDAQTRYKSGQTALNDLKAITQKVDVLPKDGVGDEVAPELHTTIEQASQSLTTLAQGITEALQPNSPVSDAERQVVSVKTWASPKMLLYEGKPLSEEQVDAAKPGVLIIKLPAGSKGKLTLDSKRVLESTGLSTTTEAVELSVPTKAQPAIMAFYGKKKLLNILPGVDPPKVLCDIKEGKPSKVILRLLDAGGVEKDHWPMPANQNIGLTPERLKMVGNKGKVVLEAYGTDPDKPDSTDAADLTVLQSQGMAFIVAINDYANGNSLAWLVDDGKEVEKQLVEKFGYPQSNVYTVYGYNEQLEVNGKIFKGKHVTKDVIDQEFHKFLALAKDAGAKHFFIYYSGHGQANDGALNPRDKGKDELVLSDLTTVPAHAWADSLLTELPQYDLESKASSPRKLSDLTVIGLYQACRVNGNNAVDRDDAVFKDNKDKNNHYFYIQSCKPTDVSYVDKPTTDPDNLGIRHGFFGEALLRVLNNLDPHDVQDMKALTAGKLQGRIDTNLDIIVKQARVKWRDNNMSQSLPDTVGLPNTLPALYKGEP